jgi:ATP-dependent DNA ligase
MIKPLEPMLAVTGEPFDCEDHLYEVKWDGVRCLAAIEKDGIRLWGRKCADYTERYPELDVLGKLPPETVIDGELVVLCNGKADLNAVLRRRQLSSRFQRTLASRQTPVVYVVFDLLLHSGQSVMQQPLWRRREILAETVQQIETGRVVLSEGVVGKGKALFEQVVRQGHEGMMAKHLAGRYLPGRRSSSWKKIKPTEILPCVIIGYVPAKGGFRSLLVAAHREGQLRYDRKLKAVFS